MALLAAVLVTYVIIGGQGAIIRTDAVQAAVLVIGVSAAVGALLLAGDSLDWYVQALPAGSLSFPVSDAFGWDGLVTMLVLVGSVYLVGPDIYTRLFSARDSASARGAAIGAARRCCSRASLRHSCPRRTARCSDRRSHWPTT